MAKQLLSPFIFLVIFLLRCVTTSAQSPAQSPASSVTTNITGILDRAGQFTTLMRLLKTTQEADQINTQISNSNQGMTIFAPTDNAFNNLKAGTLNSLSDQQKVELVQFHVLPNLYSTTQFQTASNPLRTQAGDSTLFPMNVSSSGNQVNISTGVDNNVPVANTIYTDSHLAVYQVDQVLLPLSIFGSPAPAPAPAPSKDAPTAAPKGSSDSSVEASGAASLNLCALAILYCGVAAFMAITL
ncbi:Fasciclin domain-containing protein [Cephalotus follicularis]|uniref:Fasciclin domain-containing protein n=1 Tax=Cephalotus follicularis TaxID=3775 RepID=A0A1Q3BA60_CEPFO|nr:Fasciclin domain-containing protein [Cephalotus follicularis]